MDKNEEIEIAIIKRKRSIFHAIKNEKSLKQRRRRSQVFFNEKNYYFLKCAQKPYALSRSISALCRSAASSGSSKFAFSPTLASLGANQVFWALCKCRTTFNHTAIYSILTRECLLFRFCSFFVLPDSDVVCPVDSPGSARIWGCSLCR